MKNYLFPLLFCALALRPLSAQLSADCQLDIGTNMAGMADFGTELPFVDLMKNARQWYTKDVGNPNAPFDSEHATHLSYRADGYPTHIPQNIPESAYPQEAVTIWGDTRGWPAGEYVLLWEGTGSLRLFGSFSNLTNTGPGRITFDLVPQEQGIVELAIETSDLNDPIRNIRLLMPGTEATYQSQPFNPVWLSRLQSFQTVRFMDWGQTNNWGQAPGEGWNEPDEFAWEDRSRMDHYTWAYEKGIPYEMMVKLMNDHDLDGWVCVPHRASPEYSRRLAEFLRDNLEPERHLYVEFSNEIWNWIFGQAQWLNFYGCEQTGTSWPEGLVPYVQRCLDAFTLAFDGQLDRITRVAGTQLSWVDVSQRMVNNLRPGSFDAVSPTCYFGFTDAAEAVLDQSGSSATVADVAARAAESLPTSFGYVKEQKTEVADPLGLPLIFYEGGQHLTPNPFGVMPTYADALIDVQRSPLMYDLYTAWFDSLRTLQSGPEPLKIMHFSFVANRSPQFGSWGMLETMDQDTDLVPAPKYEAILENMAAPDCMTLPVSWQDVSLSAEGCAARLRWTTATEDENDYFEVNRSADGVHFTVLARVPAAGDSRERRDYEYVDKTPGAGEFFYRVTQVDFSGRRDETELLATRLRCSGKETDVTVFPNPVGDLLHLQLPAEAGAYGLRIYDASGKLVIAAEVLSGEATDRVFNVSTLTAGIYQLRVDFSLTGQSAVKRVVIR